jgi:hypothetical protein
MGQQLVLAGIRKAPSRSDVKAWVAYKLAGFELRLDARKAKRARKRGNRLPYGRGSEGRSAEGKVLGGGDSSAGTDGD